MHTSPKPAYFGPYKLLKPLSRGLFGMRWRALHARRQSSHVVTAFDRVEERSSRRRLALSIQRVQGLCHDHILPIEHASFDASGDLWAVSPYLGNQDELVDLPSLLDMRGGRLNPIEVEHAAEHLLGAIVETHQAGLSLGGLSLDQILVCRRGRLALEHPGLAWLLHHREPNREANDEEIREDLRSAAETIYTLLTGMPADTPLPPSRVVRRLGKQWDAWIADALRPEAGFESASEMLDALLREDRSASKPSTSVRVVLGRFRRTETTGSPEND